MSKTDNKLLYNSIELIKNTLMYIKNVIHLLPNYLQSESPNKFEALVASATNNGVSVNFLKTTQPNLFIKILKNHKSIKSFVTLVNEEKQEHLKTPSKTAPTKMLVLLNQCILLDIRFNHLRNNISIGYANEKSVTNDAEFKQTVGAIRSSLLKCISKKSENKGNINLLMNDSVGFYTSKFKIESNPTVLEEYYNDDIIPFNMELTKKLKEKNSKGIVFLHGKPGTGKTTYIRHLVEQIDKKIIYIPSNMAHQLADPKFLDFMANNKNSILIIEDAESVISSREKNRSNTISNLLNISDGLLSDCLNIQIICTFNISIFEVDQAFLRAGRLLGAYEFKPLCTMKANALIKKHQLNKVINEPTSIANLFSLNLKSNESLSGKIRSIGFAS